MDSIDLNAVVWHHVPNPATWPITKRLDGVEFSDRDVSAGVRPITDAQSWPEVIPVGWEGPITYSLWLIRRINGVWHGSCALEFFRGKEWTGAPLGQYYADWYSPGKGFGELEGLPNVAVGEPIVFMVAAGSHRLKNTSTQPGQKSPMERSPAIMVSYMANGIARPATTPDPRPDPKPDPQPGLDPRVAAELALLGAQIEQLKRDVNRIHESVDDGKVALMALQTRVQVLEDRPEPEPPILPQLPTSLSFRLYRIPITVPVTWS